MEIIYENNRLVLCVKPAGVISEEGQGSLPELLCNELGCKVFPVHRLDRGTGGVMVYAKSSGAAAKLSELIRDGKLTKEYLAVVRGVPTEESGVLKDLLYHDRSKNKSFAVKKSRAGVKAASLEYKVLATVTHNEQPLTLVQILLHTGRTHQIRVQFSSRRLPLFGDGKYGGRTEESGIALWAWRLSYPWQDNTEVYSKLPPKTLPWTLFADKMPAEKNT